MVSYAYIHCKPDGTPFYVGKGVRMRYKNFRDRNKYHKRIVAKHGQENILIGKIDCSSNDFALELEIGLIKCLRRMGVSLANFTDGGEGTVGWSQPDHVKAAVAEANRRRIWSAESKEKIGKISLGKKRPEHSVAMKEKGHWLGEKNPWHGTGVRQVGAKNHMARSVNGVHKDGSVMTWPTLKCAADYIGVTIQAISQAIKKDQRSKGWSLEHAA